jgi:hypothetical protein
VRLCGERLRAAQLCAVAVLAAVWLWSSPAFSQAVSPIEYDTTALADARLGVAVATMSELADAPELLARPSSQAFVDDTFAQIALTPDTLLRTRAERRRDALRVDSVATFDRSAAYAAMGDLTKNALLAFGAKRGAFLSLGIVAEQTAYNARVLHDAEADTQDRSTIGKDAVADSVVPGLKELRADLAAPAGHSWESTADVAQRIVAALLGSDTAVPFPKSAAVWIVVLRVRATSADARRHAAHYFLDVVHYDGRHQTVGAYPDGGLAYGHDTNRLSCALDREPDGSILRTVPVTPGLGSSSAQLAEGLVRSCAAVGTEGLHYRVASADDDRLIADILFRNGVLVGPVLRAAMSR